MRLVVRRLQAASAAKLQNAVAELVVDPVMHQSRNRRVVDTLARGAATQGSAMCEAAAPPLAAGEPRSSPARPVAYFFYNVA